MAVMRGRGWMAPEAVGGGAGPHVGAMALRAVAVRRLAVQPGRRDRLVTAAARDAIGPGRSVRLVAGGADEAHGPFFGEAGGMDAFGAMAAQAVSSRGAEIGGDGEEVVAGEAMDLLHARRANGVLSVTALAGGRRRLEAVDARGVAAHARDLLLDGVDAVAARGAHVDPALVVGHVTRCARADLDRRVDLAGTTGTGSGEEAAKHLDALLGCGMVARLAGDAAVLAVGPESELGARLVAGGAEARILRNVCAQPEEAEKPSRGERDGQRREQPEAHARSALVQRACRGERL
jgi:hypothetical protein